VSMLKPPKSWADDKLVSAVSPHPGPIRTVGKRFAPEVETGNQKARSFVPSKEVTVQAFADPETRTA
jgi:hypothetical protein